VPHQIIALIVISFFSIAFLSAFAQTEELISIKTSEHQKNLMKMAIQLSYQVMLQQLF